MKKHFSISRLLNTIYRSFYVLTSETWGRGLEALTPGPRAWALKGLGPGGPGHLVFLKPILAPPCVLAGALSYVQGSCLMCRGKVLCEEAKSYVKRRNLM